MTAKPAPVIVDGVPMCSNRKCAMFIAADVDGYDYARCGLDNTCVLRIVPCLPAIREMRAELVQLRTERAMIDNALRVLRTKGEP